MIMEAVVELQPVLAWMGIGVMITLILGFFTAAAWESHKATKDHMNKDRYP